MATNENITIDTGLTVLRSGAWYPSEGDPLCYKWVVLDRAEAEEKLGSVEDMIGAGKATTTELAEWLTDWGMERGRPGGRFADDPRTKVYGHRLLVTQRCGMDV